MSTPYYTGDAVPLKFTITDSQGGIIPSLVKVKILKPHNTEVDGDDAGIDGNVVTYTVPSSITDEDGKYKVYFICTLSYGERTHKIMFDVIKNPEMNR